MKWKNGMSKKNLFIFFFLLLTRSELLKTSVTRSTALSCNFLNVVPPLNECDQSFRAVRYGDICVHIAVNDREK